MSVGTGFDVVVDVPNIEVTFDAIEANIPPPGDPLNFLPPIGALISAIDDNGLDEPYALIPPPGDPLFFLLPIITIDDIGLDEPGGPGGGGGPVGALIIEHTDIHLLELDDLDDLVNLELTGGGPKES